MPEDEALVPSIRMRIAPDITLCGYIFLDEDHARQWLSQAFVRADKYELERVLLGSYRKCTRCNGLGHTQPVTLVGSITLEEFLKP